MVVMVDIHEEKIKIGKKFGASEVLINDSTLDNKLKSISEYGFDIIIDATGLTKICEQLFKYINKNGRIMFFGLCDKEENININPYQIFKNDLTILELFL